MALDRAKNVLRLPKAPVRVEEPRYRPQLPAPAWPYGPSAVQLSPSRTMQSMGTWMAKIGARDLREHERRREDAQALDRRLALERVLEDDYRAATNAEQFLEKSDKAIDQAFAGHENDATWQSYIKTARSRQTALAVDLDRRQFTRERERVNAVFLQGFEHDINQAIADNDMERFSLAVENLRKNDAITPGEKARLLGEKNRDWIAALLRRQAEEVRDHSGIPALQAFAKNVENDPRLAILDLKQRDAIARSIRAYARDQRWAQTTAERQAENAVTKDHARRTLEIEWRLERADTDHPVTREEIENADIGRKNQIRLIKRINSLEKAQNKRLQILQHALLDRESGVVYAPRDADGKKRVNALMEDAIDGSQEGFDPLQHGVKLAISSGILPTDTRNRFEAVLQTFDENDSAVSIERIGSMMALIEGVASERPALFDQMGARTGGFYLDLRRTILSGVPAQEAIPAAVRMHRARAKNEDGTAAPKRERFYIDHILKEVDDGDWWAPETLNDVRDTSWANALADAKTLYGHYFDRTQGHEGGALALTIEAMKQRYGVSGLNGGYFMFAPPENYYYRGEERDERTDLIRKELQRDLARSGRKNIDPERVELIADMQTRAQITAGNPPTYRIAIWDTADVKKRKELQEILPDRFMVIEGGG